jgi:hypothetical protein
LSEGHESSDLLTKELFCDTLPEVENEEASTESSSMEYSMVLEKSILLHLSDLQLCAEVIGREVAFPTLPRPPPEPPPPLEPPPSMPWFLADDQSNPLITTISRSSPGSMTTTEDEVWDSQQIVSPLGNGEVKDKWGAANRMCQCGTVNGMHKWGADNWNGNGEHSTMPPHACKLCYPSTGKLRCDAKGSDKF